MQNAKFDFPAHMELFSVLFHLISYGNYNL